MEIHADLAAAMRKMASLKAIPKVIRKVMQNWGAESVTELKQSAANMKKTKGRNKTGQLARAVGMKMTGDMLAVGTNVNRTLDVKYARIQDEGGDIFPKKGKYLTIPFPGVKGRAADYRSAGSFVMTSKNGNPIIVAPTYRSTRSGGYGGSGYTRTGGLRALFLLVPWVRIPETRWFSGPMAEREALLQKYMHPEFLEDLAEREIGFGG